MIKINTKVLDSIIVSAISIAYLYSGIFQLFPIPGFVDAGMYIGYSLNPHELIQQFGYPIYQGSRLSLVLPLYLMCKIFDPVFGHYLFISIYYVSGVIASYFIGSSIAGRQAGLLVSVLLAINPIFIAAQTFGGIGGVTTTYLMLCAAFMFSRSSFLGNRTTLLLSGIFAALAISSHLFATLIVFYIFAAYAILTMHHGIKDIMARTLKIFYGALVTILLLGAVGKFFGYSFLYLKYSLDISKAAFGGFGANYRLDTSEWIWGATRFIIPIVILVLGIKSINTKSIRTILDSRHSLVSILLIVIPLLTYIFWDYVIGGSVLQTRDYSMLLVPLYIVSFSYALSAMNIYRIINIYIYYFLIFIIAALPSFLLGLDFGVIHMLDNNNQKSLVIILLTVLVAIILLKRINGFALFVLFGVMTASTASDASIRKVYYAYSKLDFKDIYLGQIKFINMIETYKGDRQLLVCYNNKDTKELGDKASYSLKYKTTTYHLSYFDSMASIYLWDNVLLSSDFPSINFNSNIINNNKPKLIIILSRFEPNAKSILDIFNSLNTKDTFSYVGNTSFYAKQFYWNAIIIKSDTQYNGD